jgi:peptidoglycan hydrolase-like protein with peptidoglycan-binding domain
MQKILKVEIGPPFYPLETGATGNFGDITKNSLKEFQIKYNLDNKDGIVGAATVAKLNSLLSVYRIIDSSLKSSNDKDNFFPLFKMAGFPIELILSIIATESYTTNFNNENVTFDYGHGVSQATFKPIKNDIKNLQIILNNDPDTKVADSGPGSPGQETHYFGALTEDAVKRFQKKYNLLEYQTRNTHPERWGRVYFSTRAKLNEILAENRQIFATKGIPNYFIFEDYLIKGYEASTTAETFDNRGRGSQLKVEPCQNITEETSLNNYKKCYAYQDSSGFLEYKIYEPHINYNNRIFKYYSNNTQSIYANVKDGLKVLSESYKARCYYNTTQCKNVPAGETRVITIDADTNYTVTCGTYTGSSGLIYNSKVNKINGVYEDKNTKEKRPVEISCSDFKIIDSAWRYNGRVTSEDKKYLEALGNMIKVLGGNRYFGPNYKEYLSQSLSEGQINIWSDKLLWSDGMRFQLIAIYSPGEVRIYDSENRVAGIINGEIVEDIPFSVYDEQNGFILLPFSYDSYSYQVIGSEEGAYGLDIISIDNANNEIIEFKANDIPTKQNEIHEYIVDWQALKNNERGVTLKMDYEGDGVFDKTVISDQDLSQEEYILQTETIVDFDSDVLNLKSKGQFVTVYIELPSGFDVNQIDIASILLNDSVPALSTPTEVGDYDEDGTLDLMVKFERDKVQSILNPGEKIPITITGKVFHNGKYLDFRGDDIIRVIK